MRAYMCDEGWRESKPNSHKHVVKRVVTSSRCHTSSCVDLCRDHFSATLRTSNAPHCNCKIPKQLRSQALTWTRVPDAHTAGSGRRAINFSPP